MVTDWPTLAVAGAFKVTAEAMSASVKPMRMKKRQDTKQRIFRMADLLTGWL
jgi:hypothetical protein